MPNDLTHLSLKASLDYCFNLTYIWSEVDLHNLIHRILTPVFRLVPCMIYQVTEGFICVSLESFAVTLPSNRHGSGIFPFSWIRFQVAVNEIL